MALAQEWQSRFAGVHPFDETQLPPWTSRGHLRSSPEPGLGHVMLLDTYIGPKSSQHMATTFHIYAENRCTWGLTFRPQEPQAGRHQFNPELDYQYNLEALAESGFDPRRKTVIMIPGYLSAQEAAWAREATHEWMSLYDGQVNVIVTSWADSNKCIYSQAVAHTVLVARQITVLLHYLAQLAGTNLRDQELLDNVHLIGHSLGAHIAGFVGKDLGGRVGRITGLDPAGPSFDSFHKDQRLDRGDARLVEILHTNAGQMKYIKAISGLLMHAFTSASSTSETTAWFGINKKLGHIDYYANNGRVQEGCVGSLHICDHCRAGDYYVDMLKYAVFMKRNLNYGPHAELHRRTRLWAFRARDFDTFQGGAQLQELCPELVELATHLNPARVNKTLGSCAVPLFDLVTPINELIRELSDQFHIDFGAGAHPELQPSYYFRTRALTPSLSDQFMADHYLLRVHLDKDLTWWDASVCSLNVRLLMEDGKSVSVDLGKVERGHRFLSLPFAHPHGKWARLDLEMLLSATGPLGPGTKPTDRFTELFEKLFPRTISLGFAGLTQSTGASSANTYLASRCQLAVKQVEVYPVSVYSLNNLGALYGGRPLLPGQNLDLVGTRELMGELPSKPATIIAFGDMNSLGLSLESALVDE